MTDMQSEQEKNAGQSGSTENPNEEKLAGWLVAKPEDLKDLKNDQLRIRTRLLARRPDSMVMPEDLLSIYKLYEDALVNGQITEEEAIPWMLRIQNRHQLLIEKLEKPSGVIPEKGVTKVTNGNGETLRIDELRAALTGRSISETFGRIDMSSLGLAEQNRAKIDTSNYLAEGHAGFAELSPEWQRMVITRLGLLQVSSEKLFNMGAAETLPSLQALVTSEGLANLWGSERRGRTIFMPGFRIALSTFAKDLFKVDGDGNIAVTEGGKQIFLGKENVMMENKESIRSFVEYRDFLIRQLELYFHEHPEQLDPKVNGGGPKNISEKSAAIAAVSAAWNLIVAGNVIESADHDQEFKDGNIINFSVRQIIHPWKQATSKWVPGGTSGAEDLTDESWGGPIGLWASERARSSMVRSVNAEGKQVWVPARGGFADQLINRTGVGRLLPKDAVFSLFDHLKFDDSENISVKLVNGGGGKTNIEVDGKPSGLYDYISPNEIDFNRLEAANLWNSYKDVMDSAFKVVNLIIGKADLTKFTPDQLGG